MEYDILSTMTQHELRKGQTHHGQGDMRTIWKLRREQGDGRQKVSLLFPEKQISHKYE